MGRNVVVLGKGTLAIRIADWFRRSPAWDLVRVVPVVPEPAWTRSLTAWCERHGIPVVPSGRAMDALKAGGPGGDGDPRPIDLAFSVFYDRILSPAFLGAVGRALNLHNGPLPRYRGVAPINWALKNGERSHGVTVHEITPGIDDGPIVSQTTYTIHPELDEVIDVYRRSLRYGWQTFLDTMAVLDRAVARPQVGEASYYTAGDAERLGDRRGFTVAESRGEAGTRARQRVRA